MSLAVSKRLHEAVSLCRYKNCKNGVLTIQNSVFSPLLLDCCCLAASVSRYFMNL